MNKTILIIDDDPDILDSMRFVLEGEEYTVITSEKGEYAENLYDKNNKLPALIILDVLLSGRDGRTICKKLKSKKKTKHIPIIMISAHPDAEKSIQKVGADWFLAKPFEGEDLLEVLKKQLQKI